MTDHPPASPKPPPTAPAIVLVQPQMGENIGMAARAMANFGLGDLRIVAPRDGWPNEKAQSTAAGADRLIAEAIVYDTVRDAVADRRFVWATTARARGQGKRVLAPAEAMAEATADAGAAHAILFGPERAVLSNDDISLADAILTFPVDDAYPSLNLAQAVMLCAYEWRRHALGESPRFVTPFETLPAERQPVHSLFAFLETELERCGYFIPENKRAIMTRNLRNILHRIGMTEQDVSTLRGVFAALANGRRSKSRP